MTATPNQVVISLVSALDAEGIAYVLVGSFSSNAYGIPRSTKDAGVLGQSDHDIARLLGERLGADFRFEPPMSLETIPSTTKNVIYHKSTVFKIEVFHLSSDAHDTQRFSRRSRGMLDGVEVWLPSPENVVITKLRWSCGPGRQNDIDDVADVRAVQTGKLDVTYMRNWCGQHGTLETFEKLMIQADQV